MTTRVIAAIDDSAAARPVIEVAVTFARAVGARVEALHVGEDSARTARAVAESQGVELHTARGEVSDGIADAAAPDDVHAIVLGARGRPAGARPAGHVVLDVMTRVDKPVVVVPPDAARPDRLERVLVAINGRPRPTRALAEVLASIASPELAVCAVHVDDEASIPSFSDQAQHETEAFAQEFIARHLPEAASVELALRIGDPGDQVLAACDDAKADLIVVTWSRDLSPGRSEVVRNLLERSPVPVVFVTAAAS